MIPKIIHYCWLSGDPFPPKIQNCINSWKKLMPDYEFICWDMNKFDIHSVKFVEQACNKRKWAFAADYIRLYALYTCGGIYIDSDVIVYKRFDEYLSNHAFASIESYFYKEGTIDDYWIDAAMIGAEKENPFIKECLDYYNLRDFIHEDGSLDQSIICHIIAQIAEDKYGFVRGLFKENVIYLNDKVMTLYPPYVFTHLRGDFRRSTVALHLYVGSWREENSIKKIVIHKTDALFIALTNERIWSLVRTKLRKLYHKLKSGYK